MTAKSKSPARVKVPTKPAAFTAMLGALRALYDQELERLAEVYRPRFESGELGDWDGDDSSPTDRLEEVVRAHFGLGVTESHLPDGDVWFGGGWLAANVLLAASWWAEPIAGDGWNHPADHAAVAIAQDLLDVVVRRGWSTRNAETPYTWPEQAGAPRWVAA